MIRFDFLSGKISRLEVFLKTKGTDTLNEHFKQVGFFEIFLPSVCPPAYTKQENLKKLMVVETTDKI
jgi:hypothetical protein